MFLIVGAWLVWGPAAVELALSHRPWDALLLVGIGLAVVHPVNNLLRPAIVAHSTKLNGWLVPVGLFGGVQAFGPSGLLLGPVLICVARVSSRLPQKPNHRRNRGQSRVSLTPETALIPPGLNGLSDHAAARLLLEAGPNRGCESIGSRGCAKHSGCSSIPWR